MKSLFFILFMLILQQRVFSQLPACKDSFPKSLLLNNSFEDFSGCNSSDPTVEGGFIDATENYGGG